MITKNISLGFKSGKTDLGPKVTPKTKSITLDNATDEFEIIYSHALSIFEKEIPKNEPIKYLGVYANNLQESFYKMTQLTLWDYDKEEEEDSKIQLIKMLNSSIGYNAFTNGDALGTYKRYVDSNLITGDNIKFKRWK